MPGAVVGVVTDVSEFKLRVGGEVEWTRFNSWPTSADATIYEVNNIKAPQSPETPRNSPDSKGHMP